MEVQRQFDRAAHTYDRYSSFQGEVGEELRQRLRKVSGAVKTVLDVGCGTATQAYWLRTEYPTAEVFCMDLAPRMLQESKIKFGDDLYYWCGTADQLAVRSASIDTIFSNLSLHWVENLEGAAREMYRVLKPGGVVVLSILTDRTLFEIADSVMRLIPQADRTPKFPSADRVCAIFEKDKWNLREIHTEKRVVHYDNLRTLLRTIKGIGGNYPVVAGRFGFAPRKFIADLEKMYDSRYRRNGSIDATYEMMWGVFKK